MAHRRSADQVLRSLAVIKPPIPVEALAAQLGAVIRIDEHLPGPCRVVGNVIGVKYTDEWRYRFCIARGLAHVLADEHSECPNDFLGHRDGSEWSANEWALDLLMPMWLIERYAMVLSEDPNRKWWQFWKLDVENMPIRMAYLFEVSLGAMNLRLSKL